MIKYRIYPSLLDNFEYMQLADTEEECEKREKSLLDAINRVEREPSYYMARGTALNELVDAAACRVPMKNEREYMFIDEGDNGGYHKLYVDGFELAFADTLVSQLAGAVKGMSPQVYCEASIFTVGGEVLLYGYPDYVGQDTVVDLKTTQRFEAGNYAEHWQHRVYPYCLVRSGMMADVYSFDYICAELSAGRDGLLDGTVYVDGYHVDFAECEKALREMLGYHFLPWLESHRDKVTDKRIFNEN